MQETKYFQRKRIVWDKLIPYGFTKEKDVYVLHKNILDNQFQMTVSIMVNENTDAKTEAKTNANIDANVDTKLTDMESGEEYVLHRVVGTAGEFVGAVREAYNSIMCDIADRCYETDVFKSTQVRELIEFVRDTYQDELEYLWEKSPNNAIWRRKDSEKWYAALLTVSRRKLGIDSDEMAEIIDLRIEPEKLEQLLNHENYFSGWHMNKKSWYTIILDGSVPTEEIKNRLEHSYELAVK